MITRRGIGGVLVVCLAAGCASPEPNSGPMSTDAFLRAQKTVQERKIPTDVEAYYVLLHGEERANFCVNAMRAGLASMRAGHDALAAFTFDEAIAEVRSPQAGSEQAERTKSRFVADREKWFKGESYERAALFFYRGLLYLKSGDDDNAAACFKQANVQDIAGEDAREYQGDWIASEIGLALASYQKGEKERAKEALNRATKCSEWRKGIPLPTADTNLLLVVEAGASPTKVREGRYGEKLVYREKPPFFREIEVMMDGARSFTALPAEDLFFQATHRGTRELDKILNDKASSKEALSNASVALGAGTVVTGATGQENAAVGALAAAAIGTSLTAAAIDPSADARSWDNLPHSIYMIPLTTPPGALIELIGLKTNGEKEKIGRVVVPRKREGLVVVLLQAS